MALSKIQAESMNLADTYAFTGTVSGAGGTNTPYFYGKKASNQTITRNVTTKITGFTNNELDSDSAFDGTTFTVPSGKAGRYYFHATTASDFSGIGSDGERALLYAYKNGSGVIFNDFFIGSSYNLTQVSNSFSWILDLSAGDTVEIYIYNKDGNASGNAFVSDGSIFFGYRLV